MKQLRGKNIIKYILKWLSAILAFLCVFVVLQAVFIPKFMDESSTTVKGYSQVDDYSISVLFLGSSQKFCTVDTIKLTNDYGISSFDYGASAQPLTVTEYYLKEALKTQRPRIVMVEVCSLYSKGTDIDDTSLAWNYAPMPPTIEKFNSLFDVTQDYFKSVKYAYFPLLVYHNRWNSLGKAEFVNTLKLMTEDYSVYRGFLSRDHIEKVVLPVKDNLKKELSIPLENQTAVDNMISYCREKDIQIVFFKAPSGIWSSKHTESAEEYFSEIDCDYIDLNKYNEIIGINGNTDFFNEGHLNISGAEKTTDFLATLIQSYL